MHASGIRTERNPVRTPDDAMPDTQHGRTVLREILSPVVKVTWRKGCEGKKRWFEYANGYTVPLIDGKLIVQRMVFSRKPESGLDSSFRQAIAQNVPTDALNVQIFRN